MFSLVKVRAKFHDCFQVFLEITRDAREISLELSCPYNACVQFPEIWSNSRIRSFACSEIYPQLVLRYSSVQSGVTGNLGNKKAIYSSVARRVQATHPEAARNVWKVQVGSHLFLVRCWSDCFESTVLKWDGKVKSQSLQHLMRFICLADEIKFMIIYSRRHF